MEAAVEADRLAQWALEREEREAATAEAARVVAELDSRREIEEAAAAEEARQAAARVVWNEDVSSEQLSREAEVSD